MRIEGQAQSFPGGGRSKCRARKQESLLGWATEGWRVVAQG